MNTNIIKIDRHVPIPINTRGLGLCKYNFMGNMEIGESFEINDSHQDFTPMGVRSHAYQYKRHNKGSDFRFAVRVTSGNSKKPRAVRVWRIK
jgi:hypothetical protein|tara:strand:+ start:100 stop:375 length:276 start_codon:yes stop_codon:yes gene_type:complete